MNKRDLQKVIANNAVINWVDAGKLADAIVSAMQAALVSGEGIVFRDFGSLELKQLKERRACKIGTEDLFTIPAHTIVRFHSHPELLKKLNTK